MSRRLPIARGVALAAAAVLLVAACSDDGSSGGDTPATTVSPTPGPGGTAAAPTSLDGVRIRLRPVAEVRAPVAMAARTGTDDLYVAEQSGQVRRIAVGDDDGTPTYRVDETPVLDLTDVTRRRGEQGLLGLAFSPDGDLLYVDYTDLDGTTHVVEYRMDGDRADPASARALLEIPQPFPNHNGGQLAFGPDGFLYVAMGDGGAAGDPGNRGQDTTELLGKILRIDPATPTGTRPYGIPTDNPFVDGGGAPEIWLYGVRNPWRFSFDSETGDLWVADVGQNSIEEITWLPATDGPAGRGANLGWAFKEGFAAFEGRDAPPGLVDPILDYDHDDGSCSVTGGYVYRGAAIPALVGAYLYADYCTAEVQGLLARDGEVLDARSLGVSVAANSLSSFGRDNAGELYVLSTEGTVYRVEPA